jgi:uncharacterized membrane protein
VNQFGAVGLVEPTADEKTMATLAEVLQIVAGWLAPLIIYLVRRESKFVAFHAMQALLWQVMVFVIWMVIASVWLIFIFSTIVGHRGGQPANGNALPVGMFVGMGAIWLGAMGISLINLILGIYYGIKANRGEWAEYPVIGNWARRIVRA